MNHTKRKGILVNPVTNTNFFSRLFFTYTVKLFIKGYKKELSETDICEVLPSCESKSLGHKLENEWAQQSRKKSVPYLLGKCFGKQYLLLLLTLVIHLTLTAARPRIIKKFIMYFASDRHSFTKTDGCAYGALLILIEVVRLVYMHNFQLALVTFGLKIRAGFTSLIYRRILKLRSDHLGEVPVGKSINLITKDVPQFQESLLMITYMLRSVLNILVVCCVLYSEIGWFCMLVVAMAMVAISFSTILAHIVKKLRSKTLAKTDARLQTTKEVLSGIALIKYYLWEDFYEKKIETIRKKEVSVLTKIFILLHTKLIISSAIIDSTWYIIVITLIFSEISSNAGTMFLILNSVNSLRNSLQFFIPSGIHEMAKIVAASTRIGNFLRETDTLSTIQKTDFDNFEYTTGITALTGPVGSGKSFRLKILGEEQEASEEFVKGAKTFSYASQEPWLFPATVKQNILFGSSYNHMRYIEVVTACALLDELQSLKDQDCMVVADRGANLSKGQQARINLARAIYKDCDVYLIDDCLSHLDILVADFVFEECFRKFLKDKIVIIVTQNKRYVDNFVDRVVTLDNGVIKTEKYCKHTFSRHIGNDDDLKVRKKIMVVEQQVDESITETTRLIENHQVENAIYKEKKVEGKVKLEIYKEYLKQFGGFSVLLFIFIFSLFVHGIKTAIGKLETDWIGSEQIIFRNSSSAKIIENALENRHRMLYLLPILIIITSVSNILNVTIYWTLVRKASMSIHKLLLSKILNASIDFFNKHITGDILNRFSEDMLYIEEFVPRTIYELFRYFAEGLGVIVLAATVNAYFLVGCLVFSVITTIIKYGYLRTGRALKRLEFSSRSPLIGHINATVEGLKTIRISKTQNIQCEEFDNYQDSYTSSSWMSVSCKTAFHFIVDACGFCFFAFAIILFLFLDEAMSPGSVGLGIVQIFRLSTVQFVIFSMWANLENEMTTVERILQYTKQRQESKEGFIGNKWPSDGEICYQNVQFGYNADDLVLRDVNFVIKPKTKLAIVGRTASGKTSLASTLLRLYDIKGKIYIDGVDIATVPLDLLRSKVSIIPQDPILFSGTLRENIDPTNKFSDDEIWNVLKTVHLSALFSNLEVTINCQHTNLSTGQKQLICLCRALIRNNKVVILDEVTATVDFETESMIHTIITNYFKDSTVIIITHKFRHILNYDKILVLDNGSVSEFDDPRCLLQNENGIFYKMYYTQNQ